MSKDPQQSPGRTDILAAALREFADHGFHGASTVRIARSAGVTQPLVHHHFGNKQGLWKAVVEELFSDLEQTLARTLREVEGADQRTRVSQLLRAVILFTGRRPEISRLTLLESNAGGAPFDELYTRLSGLIDLFRRELDAGVKDGTFRDVDPQLAYPLLESACVQPFAEPQILRRAIGLDMRQEDEIARYADFAVDVLMRGLSAAPERASDRAPRTPRR